MYRIYISGRGIMALEGSADDRKLAVQAANARLRGSPLPEGVREEYATPGVVTGIPVWVRERDGVTAMVTEHETGDPTRVTQIPGQLVLEPEGD